MADSTLTDRPFRRALYALLVVVGMFAAAAFFYARESRDDLRDATLQRDTLQRQITLLIENQRDLLADADSMAERQARTERLLAALLAGSSDPAVADAFRREVERDEPTPTRSSPAAPAPSPQPSPGATPAPSPSSSPSSPPPAVTVRPPIPLPVPLPCTSIVCVRR